MPIISDLLSLGARTAAKASIWQIAAMTLGVCIAVIAIKDDNAARGEFAIVAIPDYVVVAIPPAARVAQDSRPVTPRTTQEATDRFLQPVSLRSSPNPSRRQTIVAAGPAITGIASMYNPHDRTDPDAGNVETASGQLYDIDDWTAAIQTELRAQFGGVRFGQHYRPAFALVEAASKQAIVRINDVGPLLPGRIIDLNERAMRYFDPSLRRGLLHNIQVTPLAGPDWVAGPVIEDPAISVANR